MRSRLAAAAVFTLLCGQALAADRTLSARDLDTLATLRDAQALATARAEGPGGKAARVQADADFRKALAAAGWTAERYEQADAIVRDVESYLDADPSEAKDFWEGNERVDAATIAAVKARRAQFQGGADRARQALQAEREAGVMGKLATPADLQGTWRRDPAASRAHLAAALRLDAAQLDRVEQVATDSTFTFSGDQVEVREVRGGASTTWKGSYRLDGRAIVFGRQGREERMQVGVKSRTELVFGAMGIPSGVFTKR